jgi:hypothetical protein
MNLPSGRNAIARPARAHLTRRRAAGSARTARQARREIASAILDRPAAETAMPGWRASADGRATMSDFCGIELGAIPEFAEVGGGAFMSVQTRFNE